MRRCALLAIAVCGGCPGDSDDKPATPQPPPTLVAPIDAAPSDAGIKDIPAFDPSSGMHLDDDDGGALARTGSVGPRNRRYLEILLRSTPPGATAAVDGQVVGKTPVLWEGEFTGREREFTFRLPGYGLGRYRFVPISSGIVHARLSSAISDELRNAGIPLVPPGPEPPPPPPRWPAARRPAPPDAIPAAIPPDSVDAAATPPEAPPIGPPP